MAKGLKDIQDATLRNTSGIELQEKILAAQATQTELIQRISALEKEVADFEAWEAEKDKYELKYLGYGCFALMREPEASGAKPPH